MSLFFIITLTACENLPQVSAEDRLFLDISLEFLGEFFYIFFILIIFYAVYFNSQKGNAHNAH